MPMPMPVRISGSFSWLLFQVFRKHKVVMVTTGWAVALDSINRATAKIKRKFKQKQEHKQYFQRGSNL